MNDTKYNGWTNYATWRVNLELFDGYDLEDLEFDDTNECATYLEELAQEFMHSNCSSYPDTNTICCDYADAFVAQVNFYEIAELKMEERS